MGVIRNERQRLARKRARRLRRSVTVAEARLWSALRDRQLGGWKWRRQVPVGSYVADFLCEEGRLVIEVDGASHLDRVAYDRRRSRFLSTQGLRVIRFWNADVLENADGVCISILAALGGDKPGWDAMEVATARLSLDVADT